MNIPGTWEQQELDKDTEVVNRDKDGPKPPYSPTRDRYDLAMAGKRVTQRPNDWGLGFEIRDGKSPHWTGSANSARTFGHFGQSGTFLWVDPDAGVALVVLTDRRFGEWAHSVMPALSDEVLREFRRD